MKVKFLKFGLTALTMAFAMTLCYSCSNDDDDATLEEPTPPSNASGEINGHDYVDLGLPSGTKWATCNVGASKPEEYGDYYAWGETETKTTYYDFDNYKWANYLKKFKYNSNHWYGEVDNKEVLDWEDDVAHEKWGGSWHIPTVAEAKELYEKCTMEWTTLNGIKVCKVTGPNKNTIFLPAAGQQEGEFGLTFGGKYGIYWANAIYGEFTATAFVFDNYLFLKSLNAGGTFRSYGLPVRPVAK